VPSSRAEESQERLDNSAFGSHGHFVDRQSPQEMLARLPLGQHLLRVGFSYLRMAGVDLERLTGLGIDEARDPDIRKLSLARVLDRDRNDVVTLCEQLERMIDVCLEKVRDDEHDRVLVQHPRDIVDCRHHVRSPTDGLEGEQIADDAQHVSPSLPRRNHVLDAIGEQEHAHAIVVSDCRHREHRRQLGGKLALESLDGSKSLRARQVDDEHHGQLALLDVPLHEGSPHARGDVPIDRAHLVAGLVLAHLGELHPLTLEYRAVLAREDGVDEPARAELDELHLPQDLRRHAHRFFRSARRRDFAPAKAELSDHGAGIASRTLLTISSLVTSSASAS
jgi:hypothetical protein